MRELRAERLARRYQGRTVVKDISLTVTDGCVMGLLGPNGAGKPTTFHMMAGLIHPGRGRIWLDDQDITSWPVHRRAQNGIAYLSQEASVFRQLKVAENLLAVLEQRPGINGRQRHEKASELLTRFRLDGLRNQRAGTLSGGERRRLEIARALALEPAFLLLDEPFAGVDPICVQELRESILELRRQGLGILITDHNVREALSICDRASIVHGGQIMITGEVSSILANPAAQEFYLGKEFRL